MLGIVVGLIQAKPGLASAARAGGLGKDDKTAWRRAWGGTTNHG